MNSIAAKRKTAFMAHFVGLVLAGAEIFPFRSAALK